MFVCSLALFTKDPSNNDNTNNKNIHHIQLKKKHNGKNKRQNKTRRTHVQVDIHRGGCAMVVLYFYPHIVLESEATESLAVSRYHIQNITKINKIKSSQTAGSDVTIA